ELKIDAFLIRDTPAIAAAWRDKGADDRLDQRGHCLAAMDERVVPQHPDLRIKAPGDVVLRDRLRRRSAVDREVAGRQVGVRERAQIADRIGVAADAGDEFVLATDAVAEGLVPLAAKRKPPRLRTDFAEDVEQVGV